jgi:hypothetical protein
MRCFAWILPLMLLGCGRRPETSPTAVAEPQDPEFEKEILGAAQGYRAFGRVDDEMRWAPYLCRQPEPSRARLSDAAGSAHARKLYFVFARNRMEYVKMPGAGVRQSPGQVIVKEAWVPEVVPGLSPEQARLRVATEGDVRSGSFVPYAAREGKVYHAARPAGLFIMLKTSPDRPGTDDGWVYATTSADGRTVTSSGRLTSCMTCHRDAPHDRLFGLTAER